MVPATDGILLIDKEPGESSHTVVTKIRSTFPKGAGVKVGHAGTLDPFATGLLVVLLGQGTKLSRFIMAGEKVYLATMVLGVETDTLDPTGTVQAVKEVPDLSPELIRQRSKKYVGKIRQVPPAYSAIKHKGRRAYCLARKGHRPTLEVREVHVHSLQITAIDLPKVTMRIRCSSGTYIRSIASDLGKDLGPGGHLSSLRRLRSGPFRIEDALPSGDIPFEDKKGALQKRVIPVRDALPDVKTINVQEDLAEKIRHGFQPTWEELAAACGDSVPQPTDFHDGWFKLIRGEDLVAIMKILTENDGSFGKLRIERIFTRRGRVG